MLRSSFSVLLCSPTATGTAVQPGARTPPTAPRPTWASAAPGPPRGHAEPSQGMAGHRRGCIPPQGQQPEHSPSLMAHHGKTLLEVPAEGRKTSTTRERLESLRVHEQPGLGVLGSTGTKLSRNVAIMFSKIT